MLYNIDRMFTYHAPSADQVESYEKIGFGAKFMAGVILDETPESRERSLAFAKLQEAVFWANAAIAHNKREVDTDLF